MPPLLRQFIGYTIIFSALPIIFSAATRNIWVGGIIFLIIYTIDPNNLQE